VRAFMRHVEVSPWEWTPAMADEWFADMRGVRHLARSTLRGHQGAIRGFCSFITDPAYGWAQVCEEQFGAHPIQVLNEVNSAAHVADFGGGRGETGVHPRRGEGYCWDGVPPPLGGAAVTDYSTRMRRRLLRCRDTALSGETLMSGDKLWRKFGCASAVVDRRIAWPFRPRPGERCDDE
jgi:hypothetical protein